MPSLKMFSETFMHHYKDSSIPQPIMVARAALISCLFAVFPVAIFQKTFTTRHLHKGKIPMQEIGGSRWGRAFAQRGRIFGNLWYNERKSTNKNGGDLGMRLLNSLFLPVTSPV